MKKLLFITLLATQIQPVGTLFAMNYTMGITKKPGRIPVDYKYNNLMTSDELQHTEHYMYLCSKQCPICFKTLNTGTYYPIVFPCRFLCCLQCIKADLNLTCLTCGKGCDQELLNTQIKSLEGN